MKTITKSALALILLSATATTVCANGSMGNSSGTSMGNSSTPASTGKPSTPSKSGNRPTAPSSRPAPAGTKAAGSPCFAAQTAQGYTNCHGWSGPQVNPGRTYTRWRDGYIGGSEVLTGVRAKPAIYVVPGGNVDTSGFRVPHLGVVPNAAGTPDHSFVVYPGGAVGQRFDTRPGNYQNTFPNMNAFRGQEFPSGTGRVPFTGTTFQIYCPPGCTQHR